MIEESDVRVTADVDTFTTCVDLILNHTDATVLKQVGALSFSPPACQELVVTRANIPGPMENAFRQHTRSITNSIHHRSQGQPRSDLHDGFEAESLRRKDRKSPPDLAISRFGKRGLVDSRCPINPLS